MLRISTDIVKNARNINEKKPKRMGNNRGIFSAARSCSRMLSGSLVSVSIQVHPSRLIPSIMTVSRRFFTNSRRFLCRGLCFGNLFFHRLSSDVFCFIHLLCSSLGCRSRELLCLFIHGSCFSCRGFFLRSLSFTLFGWLRCWGIIESSIFDCRFARWFDVSFLLQG